MGEETLRKQKFGVCLMPVRRKKLSKTPVPIPPQSEQPRLLRVPQAAAYLGVKVWSMRRLLRQKKIRFLAIGNRHLIDRGDLDRFIEDRLSGAA